MAVVVNRANGNWSSASTWALVENSTWANTLALQETGVTALTTAYQSSVTFTVPTTQTLQGMLLKLGSRVNTTGNSVTARIFNVTGGAEVANTNVTIDVLDMPNGIAWVYFKFSANATLNTATNYRIDILSNVANSASFQRKTATTANWTFGLVTTTQQVPAATDQIIICGENSAFGVYQTLTVTMDNTAATVFGPNVAGASAIEISGKGVLAYSTAAATNTQLNLDGNLTINQDGDFRMGTLAAPIPSTSTATLAFDNASNVQYGLQHRVGGIITTYGASKVTKTTLAASSGPGALFLTSNASTSWSSGELIAVAPTVRGGIAQAELISTTSAATGTNIPVPALGFLHEGSASANSPRADVVSLSRNVLIKGFSSAFQTYFVTGASGTVSCNWTAFQFFGSASAGSRGIESNITSGTFDFVGCAFYQFEVAGSCGILLNSATSIANIQNCVFYRQASMAVGMNSLITLSGNTLTVNDCVAIGGTSMGTIALYNLTVNAGTYTNLVGSAGSVSAILIQTTSATSSLVMNNWTAYNCTGANIQFNTIGELTQTDVMLQNFLSYRSSAEGILLGSSVTGACINTELTSGRLFGNATRGLTVGFVFGCLMKNILIYNEAGNDQPNGIVFNNHIESSYFDSCQIGVLLPHSSADVRDVCPRNEHVATFRNCFFGSTTEFAGLSNYTPQSAVGSARHEGVAGSHRMYKKYGTISTDTTFFKVASPSQRLTPSDTANKLRSQEKRIAIPSGQGATVSVWVRKSVIGDGTAYNGNEVQVLLLADPAIGINADTVIATSSVFSNGDFELITGSIPAITDNGVARLLVTCDGTQGWVNVDLWAVTLV
jgi:hypothetical protein